jgi:antitoxin ParD1/3/4
MSISLPESLRSFAEMRAQEDFGSVSEYLEDLLRQDQRRSAEERLETLLLEGLDSGEPVEVTPQYWEDMKQRVAAKLKKTRGEDASCPS